ncbi:MAG: DUF3034 family protein, partial [Rhodanobacter sp.]
MHMNGKTRFAGLIGLALGGCMLSAMASATDGNPAGPTTSNKLLLTGGVSQLEGAAGGGLTPWAVIG